MESAIRCIYIYLNEQTEDGAELYGIWTSKETENENLSQALPSRKPIEKLLPT